MVGETMSTKDTGSSKRGEFPLIIAHRGAGHHGPGADVVENTLGAFRRAIDIGANGIELDVRRTIDNVLVVHHNKRIRNASGSIADMTFRQATVLAARRGYEIPTLEQALELCAGKIALDIELKESGYEKDVADLVRRYFSPPDAVFTSFADATVAALKSEAPEYKAGLLVGARARRARRFPRQRLESCGADFVAAHWLIIRKGFARRMIEAGYPIYAWTVNNPAIAGRLARKGVAGIISNAPENIMAALKQWR